MSWLTRPFALAAVALAAAALATGCGGEKEPGGTDKPAQEAAEPTGEPQGAQVVEAGNQQTCPVMGNAIDKDIYADHGGKRVYFCCAACVDKFEEEPEKYIQQMEADGVELATVAPAEGGDD
ncbi:MAG: YHS domain-containing protein [Candidatus Brocadiia bacterium]